MLPNGWKFLAVFEREHRQRSFVQESPSNRPSLPVLGGECIIVDVLLDGTPKVGEVVKSVPGVISVTEDIDGWYIRRLTACGCG